MQYSTKDTKWISYVVDIRGDDKLIAFHQFLLSWYEVVNAFIPEVSFHIWVQFIQVLAYNLQSKVKFRLLKLLVCQ
jgi:hypothetical protein